MHGKYPNLAQNDIYHHLPVNAANSGNPFLPPPLASSDPKYPVLPINSMNCYGSGAQSSPQDINQQNAFPAQTTVTQPILSGLIGSQTVVSGVTTTVTALQTPILSTSQVVPTVIISVSTGARPKVVMSPRPASHVTKLLPDTDPGPRGGEEGGG